MPNVHLRRQDRRRRDMAVFLVDADTGYTAELAPHRAQHEAKYNRMEELLKSGMNLHGLLFQPAKR